MSKYQEYANVFNQYDLNFCFRLNLGRGEFDSIDYINGVKQLQANGHELMDHTPQHRTSFFSTNFDLSLYSSLIGVDHLYGNKICLEYAGVNISKDKNSGYADISGNNITSNSNEFDNFTSYEHYLYFPELQPPKLVLIKEIVNADTLTVTDAWLDNIALGNHVNVNLLSPTFT